MKAMDESINNCVKKISLCISSECFLKCIGCYNEFCAFPDISKEQISKFIKYAKEKGLQKVTLSGGDPLCRKDIEDIIYGCLDLDLKVNLDTVGLSFINSCKVSDSNELINQFENYDLLKKINFLGIPLDGSSEEIVKKFRNFNDNLFNKTLQILDLMEHKDINVCINTVFHRKNQYDMINIYNIIKKYKCVKRWQIFQYTPIGTFGKINENLFKVDEHNFIKIKNEIEKINDESIFIEFKTAKEKTNTHMIVNSNGKAYKVDINNEIKIFGHLNNSETWKNIIDNL